MVWGHCVLPMRSTAPSQCTQLLTGPANIQSPLSIATPHFPGLKGSLPLACLKGGGGRVRGLVPSFGSLHEKKGCSWGNSTLLIFLKPPWLPLSNSRLCRYSKTLPFTPVCMPAKPAHMSTKKTTTSITIADASCIVASGVKSQSFQPDVI